MAVACSEPVAVPAGSFRADELAALVPARGLPVYNLSA